MDFRTIYHGSPWWVQTLAGLGVSFVAKVANPAAPVTNNVVPFKRVVAAQMIATTGTELSKTAIRRVFVTNSRGNLEIQHIVDNPEVKSHNLGVTQETQTEASAGLFDSLPGPNWVWSFGLSVGINWLLARAFKQNQPELVPVETKTIADQLKTEQYTTEEIEEIREVLFNVIAKTENIRFIGVPTFAMSLGQNIALLAGCTLGLCVITAGITLVVVNTVNNLPNNKELKNKEVKNNKLLVADGLVAGQKKDTN